MFIVILMVEQFMDDEGVQELDVLLLTGFGVDFVEVVGDRGDSGGTGEEEDVLDYG